MKLKEKLAREHAESEQNNGNAEISFIAGFDAATNLMVNEYWQPTKNNIIACIEEVHYDVINLGKEEVNET